MTTAPAPPASTYSYAQLEQLWINAGGSSATAPTAAAIAIAESGGISNAAYPGTTVAPGQGSNNTATGLWQILGVPAGFTPAQLTDPVANAQMAVAKYNGAGGSFTPWQTYTDGTYVADLANNVPPSSTGVPTGSATASTTAAVTVVPGTCVIPYPTLNLVVTTVGGGCLFSKSQARAVIGGLCIAAGALIAVPGLVILVAAGFRATGAAAAVNSAAGPLKRIPGYGAALAAV